MIALTAKCYFVEGKGGTKYSCKGMSKKQNEMTWQRYMAALKGRSRYWEKHGVSRAQKRYGDVRAK